MAMGEAFISRKCCKIYENTVKSPDFTPSFIFSKAIQWAAFEIWPTGLMFDTPDLEHILYTVHTLQHLIIFNFFISHADHIWVCYVTALGMSSVQAVVS